MTLTKDRATETGDVTGPGDKGDGLLWFTTTCLENAPCGSRERALRLEEFAGEAERSGDRAVANLLRRAQKNSVGGAEEGKALLHIRVCAKS